MKAVRECGEESMAIKVLREKSSEIFKMKSEIS